MHPRIYEVYKPNEVTIILSSIITWVCLFITTKGSMESTINYFKLAIGESRMDGYWKNVTDVSKVMIPETMLPNQTTYNLNKSKSKSISVGLYYLFQFASVVKIFGSYKQYVVFYEDEWKLFLEQRDDINKDFHTLHMTWRPRQIGSKNFTFEIIGENKVLKIEDINGNGIYLAWEAISEVWNLQSLLTYRLSDPSAANFKHFYDNRITVVATMPGGVKNNIHYIVDQLSEKSNDVFCMLEVHLFMLEMVLLDVDLEKHIQEKDLKRVHCSECGWNMRNLIGPKPLISSRKEAVFGLERYYTVRECEQLQNKYETVRKICTEFLQGIYCVSCLVLHLKKVGCEEEDSYHANTIKE
ncbi:hypothetical protein FQA39_LY17774 [Lamprigera yunnana]|nr:hypothetical protein FQA39_LY17774 [Lamprigera yunnana]